MKELTDNQYHHLSDAEKLMLKKLNLIESKLEQIINNGKED